MERNIHSGKRKLFWRDSLASGVALMREVWLRNPPFYPGINGNLNRNCDNFCFKILNLWFLAARSIWRCCQFECSVKHLLLQETDDRFHRFNGSKKISNLVYVINLEGFLCPLGWWRLCKRGRSTLVWFVQTYTHPSTTCINWTLDVEVTLQNFLWISACNMDVMTALQVSQYSRKKPCNTAKNNRNSLWVTYLRTLVTSIDISMCA